MSSLSHVKASAANSGRLDGGRLMDGFGVLGEAAYGVTEGHDQLDTLVIGGGYAGMSAALLLGRCGRRVQVVDAGEPRNRAAVAMHCFLSREGMAPGEFLRVSRDQLSAYPSVTWHAGKIDGIRRDGDGFAAWAEDGASWKARTVLLATGIHDCLPDIPGIAAFYGISVHHCPYCDGWEHRDQPMVVTGAGTAAIGLAEELLLWTNRVAFVAGPDDLDVRARTRLEQVGVQVVAGPVVALEGAGGELSALACADGTRVACRALFFSSEEKGDRRLANQLGCRVGGDDELVYEVGTQTTVRGVYCAGNASAGLQLAVVAAADGVRAAHEINGRLLELKAPTAA